MTGALRECAIFRPLDDETLQRVADAAELRSFEDGQRPFELGQLADCFFVVRSGEVDLCVPITVAGTVQEVALQRNGPGSAVGWSAFVKPNRFRLSARAVGDTELVAIRREALLEILSSDWESAFGFMERVAELTAERMLRVQALWVRGLQRSVHADAHATSGSS